MRNASAIEIRLNIFLLEKKMGKNLQQSTEKGFPTRNYLKMLLQTKCEFPTDMPDKAYKMT